MLVTVRGVSSSTRLDRANPRPRTQPDAAGRTQLPRASRCPRRCQLVGPTLLKQVRPGRTRLSAQRPQDRAVPRRPTCRYNRSDHDVV